MQERREAQLELWAWLKRRETYWAQSSRAKWIKDEDKNVRFFHSIASFIPRNNAIDRLVIDGHVVEKQEDIQREVVSFLK